MLQPKLILSPVDFSDSSLEALDVARDLAARYSSEILLLHAVPVIPDDTSILHEASDEKDLIEASRQRLAELENNLQGQGLHARATIGLGERRRIGNPSSRGSENVDFIVIATHGMTAVARLAFGIRHREGRAHRVLPGVGPSAYHTKPAAAAAKSVFTKAWLGAVADADAQSLTRWPLLMPA